LTGDKCCFHPPAPVTPPNRESARRSVKWSLSELFSSDSLSNKCWQVARKWVVEWGRLDSYNCPLI
jgi:hypothetical protein